MKKRRQWLMDNTTFQSFDNYRLQKYKAKGIQDQINDKIITQYYVYTMVQNMRRKVQKPQHSFIIQKFVHTAISLFKRFYLVNQYGDGDHEQNALTCIYLSYKINQVPHEAIKRRAQHQTNKQKNKSSSLYFKKCLHYGQVGYSQKQLYILRGIGFQLGRSPLISSVESLVHVLQQKILQSGLYRQILQQVFESLRRVYVDHRILFLYKGPKIGLAIVLLVVQRMQILKILDLTFQDIFGDQIAKVMQKNQTQIQLIRNEIMKLQKFNHRYLKDKVWDMIKKTSKNTRKQIPLPLNKSQTKS